MITSITGNVPPLFSSSYNTKLCLANSLGLTLVQLRMRTVGCISYDIWILTCLNLAVDISALQKPRYDQCNHQLQHVHHPSKLLEQVAQATLFAEGGRVRLVSSLG